ncbi:AraC family transcriptional regulator [Neolewinella lacunae]|uniref:helix-turn-helix domain-containing protein n=1 Tax=Neolewinella lacunae TaxID=1517758 RepID=UPI0016539CFB|nr:AraC family transcriptional regulator [Neolewinella lacunae]MDN3634088.1 AraC family transcriptional regulator [Neolewinella lacunae]
MARHAIVPHLYNRWHHHFELELMYVIRGEGTRFVGQSILPFYSGDMVLVGSNVPHFWQSDPSYFQGDEQVSSELILVQFAPDLIKGGFDLPEMEPIKTLIQRAQSGLSFHGQAKEVAHNLLWDLVKTSGSHKLIVLLHLLTHLAQTSEVQNLFVPSTQQPLNVKKSERLSESINFIRNNYVQKITLSEVAEQANMSEQAFCRYFKTNTQKTVLQFINELRVSHACNLLMQTEMNVCEICFASGFNNVSNFNRFFKRIVGTSPLQYRGSLP